MHFYRWHEAINQLAEQLRRQHWQLVCAESCTGGLLGAALTSMPGSSDWFTGGWISYSNEFKQRQLAVSTDTLQQYGAVSEATVEAMVKGAQQQSGAEVAVAISGIAGPGGGSADKPVGTVCIGWGVKDKVWSQRFLFQGDRDQIRENSVTTTLENLLLILDSAE